MLADSEHPQNIKEGIRGQPVSWYGEVFDLVFPDLDRARASNIWKEALEKPAKEKERDDAASNA